MTRNKIIGLAVAILAAALIVAAPMLARGNPQTSMEGTTGPTEQAPIYHVREPSARNIIFRSMIPDVEITGFTITSDQQVKVSVRYAGTQRTPSLTVVVTTEWMRTPVPYLVEAVPTNPDAARPDAGNDYYPRPYPSLIGSTIVTGDWSPTTEVKLGLVGTGTAYDFTTLQILILPYTGNTQNK